jgi:hypothetical protein
MFTSIFGYGSGFGKSYGSLRLQIHNTDFSAYFRPNLKVFIVKTCYCIVGSEPHYNFCPRARATYKWCGSTTLLPSIGSLRRLVVRRMVASGDWSFGDWSFREWSFGEWSFGEWSFGEWTVYLFDSC